MILVKQALLFVSALVLGWAVVGCAIALMHGPFAGGDRKERVNSLLVFLLTVVVIVGTGLFGRWYESQVSRGATVSEWGLIAGLVTAFPIWLVSRIVRIADRSG